MPRRQPRPPVFRRTVRRTVSIPRPAERGTSGAVSPRAWYTPTGVTARIAPLDVITTNQPRWGAEETVK